MNVKELNEKYQRLQNWGREYRKELISYINEAFAMHGNEFVLKPEGCETWEEADEIDQGLDATNRIPVYLIIYDKYSDSHEIYPTKIYRHEGGYTEYVNGYDYGESTFTEGWEADSDMESLYAIASFINAVLEQEHNQFGYPRKFNKNEQVAVCEEYGEEYYAIVELEQHADDGDDIIGLYPIGEDGKCSLPPRQVKAKYVYQKADGKVCPGCGGPLYVECNTDDFDYAFYCPECQGNFFDNEVE